MRASIVLPAACVVPLHAVDSNGDFLGMVQPMAGALSQQSAALLEKLHPVLVTT